jgi:hypothetical protein
MLSPLSGVTALASDNFMPAFSFREFAEFFRGRVDCSICSDRGTSDACAGGAITILK